MSVTYRSNDSSAGAIPVDTVIKTTTTADGQVQHVNVDGGAITISSSDFPAIYPISSTDFGDLIETRVQTPTKTKAMNVQIGPGDVISKIPVTMPYDHHQLHEGEMFRWSVYTASLGSAANKDIRIVVPNISITANAVTQCPHFRLEFISSAGGLAYLYEGTTFTANGTQRTPIAMERNGTYTPLLQIHEDPTVNAVGTVLWQGLLLASKVSAGDTNDSAMEFILKNNTSYLVRFTSAGNSNQVLIRLVWYEDLGV